MKKRAEQKVLSCEFTCGPKVYVTEPDRRRDYEGKQQILLKAEEFDTKEEEFFPFEIGLEKI